MYLCIIVIIDFILRLIATSMHTNNSFVHFFIYFKLIDEDQQEACLIIL